MVFTYIAHWEEIKAHLGKSKIHVVDAALYQHNLLVRQHSFLLHLLLS